MPKESPIRTKLYTVDSIEQTEVSTSYPPNPQKGLKMAKILGLFSITQSLTTMTQYHEKLKIIQNSNFQPLIDSEAFKMITWVLLIIITRETELKLLRCLANRRKVNPRSSTKKATSMQERRSWRPSTEKSEGLINIANFIIF